MSYFSIIYPYTSPIKLSECPQSCFVNRTGLLSRVSNGGCTAIFWRPYYTDSIQRGSLMTDIETVIQVSDDNRIMPHKYKPCTSVGNDAQLQVHVSILRAFFCLKAHIICYNTWFDWKNAQIALHLLLHPYGIRDWAYVEDKNDL